MKLIGLPLFVFVSAALVNFAAAQPVISPDMPVMNLDEVGVYAVGYAYRGQAEQFFPLGWSGFFDDATGVACQPFGTQNGQRAFLLHCPWRNGTGIAFQQFAFALPPEATRIVLRGSTAMRTESASSSDGVTFRLYTNGQRLFTYHQTNDIWKPFEYDLTAQRGSNVTIRFEVDPGLNNNPSFDYSFWGNRELVIEGYTPPVANRPPPPPVTLSNLWSGQNTEVAPQSGFEGTSTVSLSGDVVRFRYTGPDGILEYEWHRPLAANDGLFGTINLNAQ